MTDFNKLVLILLLATLSIGIGFFLVSNYKPDFLIFGEPEIILLVSLAVSGFLLIMWIFLEATSKKPEKTNPHQLSSLGYALVRQKLNKLF